MKGYEWAICCSVFIWRMVTKTYSSFDLKLLARTKNEQVTECKEIAHSVCYSHFIYSILCLFSATSRHCDCNHGIICVNVDFHFHFQHKWIAYNNNFFFFFYIFRFCMVDGPEKKYIFAGKWIYWISFHLIPFMLLLFMLGTAIHSHFSSLHRIGTIW